MCRETDPQADRRFMREALRLARGGVYTTFPNPAVGCVFVRGGRVIGRGCHHRAGEPHAEIMALADARYDVRGATCYVTLEPCSHYGRTPPCALKLAEMGIARCVIACGDPNPLVAGRGIELLRRAGIAVTVGVLEKRARFLNRAFMKAVSGPLPYVTLKIGMSLDGKTALESGESRWITGPESRSRVQQLRAQCDVIVTGSGTVAADDPRLTVRYAELPGKVRRVLAERELRQPLKVVLDTRGRLDPAAFRLFGEGRTLWVRGSDGAGADGPPRAVRVNEHTEAVRLPVKNGRIELKALLAYLGAREYRHVLVEAGGELSSAFMNERLVDELIIFAAPSLLGASSRDALRLEAPPTLPEAVRLRLKSAKRRGADVMLRYLRSED